MASSVTIPVVAGLAIGIAFVVLFSTMLKPDSMLTDEELVAKYSKLAEVKYFIEKFPDARAEVSRSPNENYLVILYSVERQVEPQSQLSTGINAFGIEVHTRPNHLSLGIFCGVHHGVTIGWGFEDIGAIDEAEKTCFPVVDNSADELNEIDLLTFGNPITFDNVFDFNFRDMELTVAVNAVDGKSIGFFSAIEVEPAVIATYPLLQDMIEEADKAGAKEPAIIYRNISGSEADFLTDRKLAFAQTRLELARYDEVSSFINFGSETSYLIRVFEANNGDPFAPDADSYDETGVFEPETDVGEPIPVEVSANNNTSVQIEYIED